MKKVLLFFAVALILGLVATQVVNAGSDQAVMDKLEQLKKSVQMQQEQLGILQQQLEEQKALSAESRKTDLTEVKKVVLEQLGGQDVLPEWVKRIKIGSDIRIRYHGYFGREGSQYSGGDKGLVGGAPVTIVDQPDRHQPRIRWRFYVEGKITDELTAYVATCTNAGVDRGFPPKGSDDFWESATGTVPFGIIRTYIDYRPKALPGSYFGAGRFAKNFLHTIITWDPDTNPDGVYASLKLPGETFSPFIYSSFIVIDEQALDPEATLWLSQVGADIKLTKDITWTIAGTYSYYAGLNDAVLRVEGADQNLAYLSRGYGNTLKRISTTAATARQYVYAYEYRLAEFITFLKFKVEKVPVVLTFNYIENVADNVPGDRDTAYWVSGKAGENKRKGDFSLELAYYNMEPDSVFARFNDSDISHSNRKGFFARAEYSITDRFTARLTPVFAELSRNVYDDHPGYWTGTGTDSDQKSTLIQFDLMYRF